MRAGRKTAIRLRAACIATGLTVCLGLADAAADIRITVTDDAVAIKAEDTSIRRVLEELSRQIDLVVTSQEALDESLSIEIDEPTLQGAIRHLLRQKSFLLECPQGAAGTLWIFSGDAEQGQSAWTARRTLPPESETENRFIEYQILASSDVAGDREEAMYGFGDIDENYIIEYLQQGLSDPDEGVREEAMRSLADLGGTEAVMAISAALNDPQVNVRIDAVDALGEIGGQAALKLLQGALADENATVREVAAEWLAEIE